MDRHFDDLHDHHALRNAQTEHLPAVRFESRVLREDWRIDYNINRPHSAHCWLTPVEFAEVWLNR
jgi:hypothetical protein